jgi:IQ calmodulin-binding motif
MNRSSNSHYFVQSIGQCTANGRNKHGSPIVKETGRPSRPPIHKSSYSPGCARGGHHHVLSKQKILDLDVSPVTVFTGSVSSPRSSILDRLAVPFPVEGSPWMPNSSLVNTAFFRRRFNHTATRIQAVVRGMLQRKKYYKMCLSIVNAKINKIEFLAVTRIQARVRGNQARDFLVPHHAALCIQSFFKSCIARMTTRASCVAVELHRIRTLHIRELRCIERYKILEMKRIYQELTEQAAAKERAQDRAVTNLASTITRIRNDNAQLREQNKTLHKATRILAQKNARTIKLTDQIYKNFFELKDTVSSLESDNKQLIPVLMECQARVKDYKKAQLRSNERIDGERKIGERYVAAINESLKHIRSACTDKKLSRDIIQKAQSSLGLLDADTPTKA